jgi:hypothetical protein
MSHEASDDFAPNRDRVADADAAVPRHCAIRACHPAAREMVIAAVKRACEQVGFG